nr:hypothetical protein [Tanacetum cinerariifolium]
EIHETKKVHGDNIEINHSFSWANDAGINAMNHFANSPIKHPKESHKHVHQETSEVEKGDSDSPSKPSGLENLNYPKKSNSHHFSSSCPGAKSSRASKTHSIALSNNGSMIETLVTQIEMGKTLGYDMEGSTNDLKKLIERLGDKHGQL